MTTGVLTSPHERCAKSELNELVMKALARSVTNQDIIYTVKSAQPFKVSVEVPELAASMLFEGDFAVRKKAAEQSAASKALEHFQTKPTAKSAGADGTAPAIAGSLAASGTASSTTQAKGGNHKSALNELVMKLVGRPLSNTDIIYTVKSARPGQYQATAKIPVIDEMEFAAAPRPRKRDAEQCAAQMALLYYE